MSESLAYPGLKSTRLSSPSSATCDLYMSNESQNSPITVRVTSIPAALRLPTEEIATPSPL